MRFIRIAAAGIVLAAVAVAGSFSSVGASRQHAFASSAAALESRWSAMAADGVPAGSLAPLKDALRHSGFDASWWAPVWWTKNGTSVISDLRKRTDAAWAAAMSAARS